MSGWWPVRQRVRRARARCVDARRRDDGSYAARLNAAALVGTGIAIALIMIVGARFRPTLDAVAKARAVNMANGLLSRAVSEALASPGVAYGDMVTLERDEAGQVIALTGNVAVMNELRSRILTAVTASISEIPPQELGVPLGSLTGLPFLSGRGPKLPVRVLSVGVASAEFENRFITAGINQTEHRVMLQLKVEMQLLISGRTLDAQADAQVCVAETVIVGAVPDTYLQVETKGG